LHDKSRIKTYTSLAFASGCPAFSGISAPLQLALVVSRCSLLVDYKSEAKVPHHGIVGKETMEGLSHGENDNKD